MDDDFVDLDIFDFVQNKVETRVLNDFARHYTSLNKYLTKHWFNNKQEFTLHIFSIRKIRGFSTSIQNIYKWISIHDSEYFITLLPKIVYYGSWNDLIHLIYLLPSFGSNIVLMYYTSQLQIDRFSKSPSQAAEFAPTENCSIDKKHGIVKLFCQQMRCNQRQYRKILSSLRHKIRMLHQQDYVFPIHRLPDF